MTQKIQNKKVSSIVRKQENSNSNIDIESNSLEETSESNIFSVVEQSQVHKKFILHDLKKMHMNQKSQFLKNTIPCMLSEEDSEISDSSQSKDNSMELSGSLHDHIEEEKHE